MLEVAHILIHFNPRDPGGTLGGPCGDPGGTLGELWGDPKGILGGLWRGADPGAAREGPGGSPTAPRPILKAPPPLTWAKKAPKTSNLNKN